MIKPFLSLLAVFVFSGCAAVGPPASSPAYSDAMSDFAGAEHIEYQLSASWYPNVLLGSAESFNKNSIQGRLMVTPERLVFAVFDEDSGQYLQAHEIQFAEVTWATGRTHGVARLFRLQANEQIDSFSFGGWAAEDGRDKDQILSDLLTRSAANANPTILND